MSSSTAVTESMQRITTTKLEVLAKQHENYERTKSKILSEVENEMFTTERVRILLDRLEQHKLPMPASFSSKTMRAFLEQSEHDSSVSPALLNLWESNLKGSLNIPSRKYQHATLFGQLATEWLNSGETPSLDGEDAFEPVGRKEMHDQRKEWERLVLENRAEPDIAAIEKYLQDLFNSSTEASSGLQALRKCMEKFEIEQFDSNSVKLAIGHLISSDLLSHQKQAALKNLRDNDLVLAELADVLNMQLENLQSWSWGSDPVSLELRRGLNGKYRVFMDEELLTSILLQYIGLKWGVFFKAHLIRFMEGGAWHQSTVSRDSDLQHANENRGQVRGPKVRISNESVNNKRWATYQSEYFMQHLPSSIQAGFAAYGDDEAASQTSCGGEDSNNKSFTAKKQELFHLIATEALLTSHLHGSWTILQSDFRWFGPSLPHATILTLLRFYGIKKHWLDFFERYLRPTLRFSQDGPNALPFTRKCGVPISHALTDVMGEAVLFPLDFAVNKNSQGNLYRAHDDIWFWGSNEGSIAAWQTLNKYSKVMGLQLNKEKTGAAQVVAASHSARAKSHSVSTDLPCGSVRWGFLLLDPRGGWQMNMKKVEEHIAELRLQLSACKSIFAWIQAWNTYVVRFLADNFGEPARCLGKSHVDMVIATFKTIQDSLFSSESGNEPRSVTGYLKSELRRRFGLDDIPDGLLFFPTELGGLGLRSPVIPLVLVREDAPDHPDSLIKDALTLEEIDHNTRRKKYERGEDCSPIRDGRDDEDVKAPWEDVRKYVETSSDHLGRAYDQLMKEPSQLIISLAPEVSNALNELPYGMRMKWECDEYWKWVLQLYGGEIVREFGGLALGDKRLLPIGLTSMLKEQKIRWQG